MMVVVVVTSVCAEDEIGGNREDANDEVAAETWERRKLGNEMIEEVEGRDGSQPPVEFGHDGELHSLNRPGLEHVLGFHDLQVQEKWDLDLLHFRC